MIFAFVLLNLRQAHLHPPPVHARRCFSPHTPRNDPKRQQSLVVRVK